MHTWDQLCCLRCGLSMGERGIAARALWWIENGPYLSMRSLSLPQMDVAGGLSRIHDDQCQVTKMVVAQASRMISVVLDLDVLVHSHHIPAMPRALR